MKTVIPESVGLASEQLAKIPKFLQQKYVDSGMIAGCVVAVIRNGEVAHLSTMGKADIQRDIDMTEESIFRLYSMTKPITSIALMSLYEDGLFQLTDPVSKFIPAWKDLAVYVSGSYPNFETQPVDREMNIQDLLTHQSGLAYGFFADMPGSTTPVQRAYKELDLGMTDVFPPTLEDLVNGLATLPLEFSPGTAWNYSVSTDVCARLVEVISGRDFDKFLTEVIFEPLGMNETSYEVSDQLLPRFTVNYKPSIGSELEVYQDSQGSRYSGPVTHFGGGVGLTAPIADYIQFVKMLMNWGELDGKRIIGQRTLEYMIRNHLPAGMDVADHAFDNNVVRPLGSGFGLGFGVTTDATAAGVIGSEGTYNWSGAASTLFWVDPVEDLAVVYLTQSMLAGLPTIADLKALVYPAIVD
jgi:CubicO group peptidase (beta-lactamase class C family)